MRKGCTWSISKHFFILSALPGTFCTTVAKKRKYLEIFSKILTFSQAWPISLIDKSGIQWPVQDWMHCYRNWHKKTCCNNSACIFFFFKLSYSFEGSSSLNRVFCFVLIIYLFMTALGLRCCTRAFSNCGQWGLVYSCGVLASHCSGFSCCGAQTLGLSCFSSCASWALQHMHSVVVVHKIRVAWQHVESSWTRDRIHVPVLTGGFLSTEPPREVPNRFLMWV